MPEDSSDRPGRAVGVDLGARRIGVAVSDSAGTMALPRLTLERTGDPEVDRRRLADMVVEVGAVVVVVGLPLSLDGTRGPAALAAADEAEALGSLLAVHGIAVELYDERLTTVTAHQTLTTTRGTERARRPVVDQAAAAVLLEAWLAGRRRADR